MTGVRPKVGRLLDAADASVGAPVAVVSEQFWRANLGADTAAIRQTIRLGGQPFTLVGVIGGSFHGLEHDPLPRSVWIPSRR